MFKNQLKSLVTIEFKASSAIILYILSVGWTASQNKYLSRSTHAPNPLQVIPYSKVPVPQQPFEVSRNPVHEII